MFGARLVLSFALVLVLVGGVGYWLMDRELDHAQLVAYEAEHHADTLQFAAKGRAEKRKVDWVREIDEIMDATAARPGTLSTLLVDPRGTVVAAGDDRLVGRRLTDAAIRGTLTGGAASERHADLPGADRNDLEFVAPVDLPDGRYAYVAVIDDAWLGGQLAGVRRTLILIGLLVLVGGAGVFYLVGGRALMRSHRSALDRATRDGLTDLPNQRAFQDELRQAVATGSRHQSALSLVVLDVDDFKFVNDRHGHPQGDALLRRAADVLREGRTGDRVYRTGGDEFAALLPHTDADGARVIARRLQRSMSEVGIRVSIGVSALRAGEPEDVLLAEADAALYDAKRRGGNQSIHFDDIREDVVVTSLGKKRAVRQLIEEKRLTTVFQPIWDMSSGTLIGIEALSRPDPAYGLSGPAEAFDLADQLGRIHELDALCATRALDTVELPPGALLFLNICPETLDLDSDGNDWLRRAVGKAHLSPEQVVVEVTERFGGRTASVIKALDQLRDRGFRLALDDVGTGNAGLEMLRKVNAEYVKLDRSIVSAAVTEPSSRAVLMAMATFARQTGAYVIAEGIEDEETLDFLRHLGDLNLLPDDIIQGGQGFTLGRPAPTVLTATPDAIRSGRRAA